MAGMLSMAFDMPGEQDKPTVKRKANKKGSAGTKASLPVNPTVYKEPSHGAMMKDAARSEKRHATRQWIAGEMSTAKHNQVHARANRVIKGKVGR